MQDEETIKQLQNLIERLRQENELLKERMMELEARLAKYENPPTPPSLRRGRNRKSEQNKRDNGKPCQKVGHKGVTRPHAKPDRQVEAMQIDAQIVGKCLSIQSEWIQRLSRNFLSLLRQVQDCALQMSLPL